MSLGTSFVLTLISIGRKALTFQRITVIDKKLHLTTICARKLDPVVFFCLFVISQNHLAVLAYSKDKFKETKKKKKEPH